MKQAEADGSTVARGAAPKRRVDPKSRLKTVKLQRMLRRKSGVTVAAVGAALGWQVHTVRAALSKLRKAGHVILREVPEKGGPAKYRMATQPETTS